MWILILNWEDVLKVHSLACTWAQSCTLRTYSSLACSVFRWTLWHNWNQLAILMSTQIVLPDHRMSGTVECKHSPPASFLDPKEKISSILQQRLPFLDGNGEVWFKKKKQYTCSLLWCVWLANLSVLKLLFASQYACSFSINFTNNPRIGWVLLVTD